MHAALTPCAARLHAPPSRRRARRDARARAEGFRGPGGLPRHVHLSGVSEDRRPMDARPRFPHGLRGRRGRWRRVRARVPPHPHRRPHRLRAHRKRRGGHSRLHRRLPRPGDPAEDGAPHPGGHDNFAFRLGRSRETAFSRDYDELYELLRHDRDHGSIVWVMGPAFTFNGFSRDAFAKIIDAGYADAVFAGNALSP